MKKFMAPELEIVKLQDSDIIATSTFVDGFNGDFNAGGFGDGDMLSRGDLNDWEIFSE